MNPNPTPSCNCGCSGGHACDCCTGPRVLTPQIIFNVSGLSAIQRRAGTWDTFRRTCGAALRREALPLAARPHHARQRRSVHRLPRRRRHRLRRADLLQRALCQRRLPAHRHRPRRSLMELGKLVGYRPRPGVAASAWLAFKLDAGYAIEVPAGTRVQSVPASPKETAQTFKTSAALNARAELNELKPRLSVPQEISPANVLSIETIWLKGTGLNLKAGDMLLFAFPSDEAASTPRKIHTVTEDAAAQRTAVKLEVEKLSAAYHVPVLRKAAQALRRSDPRRMAHRCEEVGERGRRRAGRRHPETGGGYVAAEAGGTVSAQPGSNQRSRRSLAGGFGCRRDGVELPGRPGATGGVGERLHRKGRIGAGEGDGPGEIARRSFHAVGNDRCAFHRRRSGDSQDRRKRDRQIAGGGNGHRARRDSEVFPFREGCAHRLAHVGSERIRRGQPHHCWNSIRPRVRRTRCRRAQMQTLWDCMIPKRRRGPTGWRCWTRRKVN